MNSQYISKYHLSTTHPSTASVPIAVLVCGFNVSVKKALEALEKSIPLGVS